MKHGNHLILDRCPHCNIAQPVLALQWAQNYADYAGQNQRSWATYKCNTCGGIVLAVSPASQGAEITQTWPDRESISDEIPERARTFLAQAIASIHAPSGAVMLAASAVDAMLKHKDLKSGSLNARIDQAAANHLITQEMAAWAHEVRLNANDQRHADEDAPLPTATDATKVIEFARALAQFLFVLPARVERGRKQ